MIAIFETTDEIAFKFPELVEKKLFDFEFLIEG